MTRTPLLLTLAAAAALAGCDTNNTIVVGPDGAEDTTNAAAPVENVELPPSIVASHSYRCRDNSLVYIDWLSNDTARVKATSAEVGTTVTKGEDGSYAADGQTLTGSADAQSITVNGKSCRR